MPRFALITEGILDQVILETIVQGYYADKIVDEVDFTALQPPRDATDESRQGDSGGWEKVFELCGMPQRLLEALALNDFVIIQIDTDCCEEKNFNVPRTLNGKTKSIEELLVDVANKIIQKITPTIFEENKDKFIFAIAVHSIECWILPLHVTKSVEKKRHLNCEKHLKTALAKKNIKYEKTYDMYEKLVMGYRKPKTIQINKIHNKSFDSFLKALPNIAADLSDEDEA